MLVILENWHSQRGPLWGHVNLTFDLLTPKSIGVFLSLYSICVWSMKSLGQTLFELSRYKESVDRRTDGQTDKVITIGLPHLRWRGPNNLIACHTMWILMHAFFAETFQPMNATLTFQIGLNDCTQAIRGKFMFAGAWESFQRIRT